jgi:hypothetical protein
MRDDRALVSYAGIAPALSLSPTVTRAPTNCHCHVHTVVAERFTAFRQRSRSPRLNNQTRRTGLPQCAASGLISGRRAGRTESERGGQMFGTGPTERPPPPHLRLPPDRLGVAPSAGDTSKPVRAAYQQLCPGSRSGLASGPEGCLNWSSVMRPCPRVNARRAMREPG